jgi:hypothetical protein
MAVKVDQRILGMLPCRSNSGPYRNMKGTMNPAAARKVARNPVRMMLA